MANIRVRNGARGVVGLKEKKIERARKGSSANRRLAYLRVVLSYGDRSPNQARSRCSASALQVSD
jgi:hypothetical protein